MLLIIYSQALYYFVICTKAFNCVQLGDNVRPSPTKPTVFPLSSIKLGCCTHPEYRAAVLFQRCRTHGPHWWLDSASDGASCSQLLRCWGTIKRSSFLPPLPPPPSTHWPQTIAGRDWGTWSNKAFKKELQLSKAFDLLVKIKDSRITEMFWNDLKRIWTVIHVLRQKKDQKACPTVVQGELFWCVKGAHTRRPPDG